ncbi:MAG: GYD domain-containing protein [Candidatus Bathyarchaeota archaeon]|nr:GYD domain-containing protein [Candidatus Bathyarchaeota archaeon]
MPFFLVFVSYTQQAWDILVRSPQNREELVRPVIENLKGKLECSFLSMTNYEAVAVVQMPDNVNMAALSMAFLAQFAVQSVKTIPLISWEEGIQAMQKARQAAYKPPKTNPMITRSE